MSIRSYEHTYKLYPYEHLRETGLTDLEIHEVTTDASPAS
jgi:hypothetical protein